MLICIVYAYTGYTHIYTLLHSLVVPLPDNYKCGEKKQETITHTYTQTQTYVRLVFNVPWPVHLSQVRLAWTVEGEKNSRGYIVTKRPGGTEDGVRTCYYLFMHAQIHCCINWSTHMFSTRTLCFFPCILQIDQNSKGLFFVHTMAYQR